MENARDFLVQWTIGFVKNMDLLAKKIEHIENGKDSFDLYIRYKDREQFFIIIPKIGDMDSVVRRINNEHHFSIVTLNSKENFDIILKNWNHSKNFR